MKTGILRVILKARKDLDMAKKHHTSTLVIERWQKKAYQKYQIAFRKQDIDKKIIEYIEDKKYYGENTTSIFRRAIHALMEKEGVE